MFADQGPMLLNAHFGTNSPYWRLAFDSNALALSAVKGKTHMAVALSAMQAAKIRRLTGITASLDITITLGVSRYICIWSGAGSIIRNGRVPPRPSATPNRSPATWYTACLLPNRWCQKPIR